MVGVGIGVAVPWLAIRAERTWSFAVSQRCLPLNAVAIGLLVLALGKTTHANLFLAASAAGVTVATVGQRERDVFEEFGELIVEIFKLAALLVFGVLLSPAFFGRIGWAGWVFALLALVAARPVALWISSARSRRHHAGASAGHVVRPTDLSAVLTVVSDSLGTKSVPDKRCTPYVGG